MLAEDIRLHCGLSMRLRVIDFLTEYKSKSSEALVSPWARTGYSITFASFCCLKLVTGLVQTQGEETTHCIANGSFGVHCGPLM